MRNFVLGIIVGLVWAAFGDRIVNDLYRDIASHDSRIHDLERRLDFARLLNAQYGKDAVSAYPAEMTRAD